MTFDQYELINRERQIEAERLNEAHLAETRRRRELQQEAEQNAIERNQGHGGGMVGPIVFGALVISPTLRRAFAVFAAALFLIGLLMAVIPDQGVSALGSMMAMFAVLLGIVSSGNHGVDFQGCRS